MQLYTQFAQQAALKDKVAVVHGGITSASREVIRPVLDQLQDAVFLQHAVRGRRLRPQPVRHWRDAGANRGEAGASCHEEVGQEGLRDRGRLQLRPDHLAMGEEIRHRKWRRSARRSTSSRSTSPISARPSQDPGGKAATSSGRRWSAARISRSTASGPRPACARSIPMASTTFAVGNEHIVLSPDECNGMLVCYNYFQDLKNPAERELCRQLPQTFWRRLPQHHRTCDGNLSGLPYLGGGGQEGRGVDRIEGHRSSRKPGSASTRRQARSRSIRRRIIACSTLHIAEVPGQEAQRAGRLRPAEAGGHRRRLRSHQEPEPTTSNT